MHSCVCKKFAFHHNGDFSGDVIITNRKSEQTMEVPFDEIKALVSDWVRQEMASRLDNMGDDEVLLGKFARGKK